jgi:tol-pal system protein YbgF
MIQAPRAAAASPSRTPSWGLAGRGLLAVWFATACVTVPQFEKLEREVAALRGGSAAGGSQDRVAELGSEVAELRAEVARMRGELEELRHQAISKGGGGAARPAGAAAQADVAAVAPALGDEARSYETAFRSFRQGEYRPAIDQFKSFLQNYPSSDYADNALFWLGESYFRVGEFEQAVLTFEDVTKKHPSGNKVPDALYRQGVALLELGKREPQEKSYRSAAREVFQRIVTDHPSSERVPEARQQLEKLSP